MQQHLKREFILLFMAIVAFIIVRSLFVSESFGQYGWGNSVNELMSFNVTNANSTECVDCHQNVYSVWANGSHNIVNCDDCYGSTEEL